MNPVQNELLPLGVQLAEHVVQQQHGVLPHHLPVDLTGGQLHGKSRRAGLALAGKALGAQPIQQYLQIILVGAGETLARLQLCHGVLALMLQQLHGDHPGVGKGIQHRLHRLITDVQHLFPAGALAVGSGGVFGQFPDGVVPGMMCFEMGLSSFGDNFAWLKRFLAGTMKTLLAGKVSAEVLAEAEDKILPSLAEAAAKLPFREDAPFASDWFNGRRSPDPNPSLRATVSGLGLATDAAEVYYDIVEATAFGVKAMVDTLVDNGVALESVTAIGGIAVKSPFIVQFLADVLGMEIFVPNLTQACGLGAAINASVASGCWPGLLEAQEAMCVTEGVRYTPSSARDFSRRYERYRNM